MPKQLLQLVYAATRVDEVAGERVAHLVRRDQPTQTRRHVNSGLPIHIGAALLGHLNLETTRGYVAVFEDDLIRHYQTSLDRHRQARPAEEYRPTSDAEWVEFEAHFDKRKGELGNRGRTLRHPLRPRTQLHPLPDAARQPDDAAPPRHN